MVPVRVKVGHVHKIRRFLGILTGCRAQERMEWQKGMIHQASSEAAYEKQRRSKILPNKGQSGSGKGKAK
jgi:hypothetical protein